MVFTNHTFIPVSFGGVLILCLATDLVLIDLDRSELDAVLAIGTRSADAMFLVPGRLLTDVEVPHQLGISHLFQTGEHQIHRCEPDSTTQRLAIHDRVFYEKVMSAVKAIILLRTSILAYGGTY